MSLQRLTNLTDGLSSPHVYRDEPENDTLTFKAGE